MFISKRLSQGRSIISLLVVALIATFLFSNTAIYAQDGGRGKPNLQAQGNTAGNSEVAPRLGSLLVDQTADQNGYGGINLHATEEGEILQLAEDFTVTDPAWAVDGLILPGFWYYDDPPPYQPVIEVVFYANAGGVPGAVVCTPTVSSSEFLTLTEGTVEFATPCVLTAGTYWFSATPAFDTSDGNGFLWYIWYWSNVNTGSGYGGVFRDVNDYFGTGCTNWADAVSCGFTYGDLAFQVYGEVVTLSTLTATASCNADSLEVSVSFGDGPFSITGTGAGLPTSLAAAGSVSLAGPGAWTGVTVTETSGDGESINLGDFTCPSGAVVSVSDVAVPNLGVVQIGTGKPASAHVTPAGQGIRLGGGGELYLPADADGNGFDSYVVAAVRNVDGEYWLGLFLGSKEWAWVRYSDVLAVTAIRGID